MDGDKDVCIRTSHRRACARLTLAAGLAAVPVAARAEYGLNLPPAVTSIGARILELHNLILAICVVIFLVVLVPMLYSMIVHRKSRGVKPATFHDNVKLEALWTVVPFLILAGMAVPSTATLIEMADIGRTDLTVHVTGYQWKWEYEYPEQEIRFFSTLATPREQVVNLAEKNEHYLLEVDNPLVLPTGRRVRFVLTANDVIHAWWVPQFGFKVDTVPGFIREISITIDEAGVYRGVCAELCGKDHAFMPIVVNAVAPAEFDKWVAERKQEEAVAVAQAAKTLTKEELMASGKQVYQKTCLACHGAEGQGVQGAFPPVTGSAVATGPMEEHIRIVLEGRNTGKFPAPMPPFAAQLNDAEVAAVVTFERNALGNNTGDVVQPAQVKALR